MKQHYRLSNIIKGSLALIALVSLLIANQTPIAHGDYEAEINTLNAQIDGKKDALSKLRDQQRYYQQLIAEKQKEKASLKNQLSILDNKMAEIELDIEGTKLEIEQTELELRSLELEIAKKDQQINQAQDRLSKLIKTIDQQGSKNTLEIILMNDSFSDFLNDLEYLNNISSAVRDELEDLKDLKASLEEQQQTLNHKREQLAELQQVLADKKYALDQEKENKNFILEQTQLSESEYQALLADAQKEQEQANAEISQLERTVRQKLAQLEASRPKNNQNKPNSTSVFIWPVPKNRINAYFHDPDYPFRNVFEHPAVDIRAAQGTPIVAAADGYVAAAKDAGMGYSYIMIVHDNGLTTVYGHVSKIVVKEEDYVTAGQLIGYSGGTPGTPGAGKMTTGPHLHFEVRLNGIPVDPLAYLP